MRYFFNKSKKIVASVLIAIFVFNILFFSSAYPSEVEAKQTLKAFPTSFTSSWNNPAGVMSQELPEDADSSVFNTENSAYPALAPVSTKNSEKKNDAAIQEETPENSEDAAQQPDVSAQSEADSPTTSPDQNNSIPPQEAPTEASSSTSPLSFQTVKKIYQILTAAFRGPEKVLATDQANIHDTGETKKDEKNNEINVTQKEELKTTPDASTTNTPGSEINTTTFIKKDPIDPPMISDMDPTSTSLITSSSTEDLIQTSTVQTDTEIADNEPSEPADEEIEEAIEGPHTEQSYIQLEMFTPEHTWKLGDLKNYVLKNPRLGISLSNTSLPGHEFVVYYKSNGIWQTLVTLKLDIPRANITNKGYFYFPLKKIKNINTLTQTEIKISHVGTSQLPGGSHAFIDAVWIETEYTDKNIESKNEQNNPLLLVSEKKDFDLDEELEFDFSYEKGKKESRSLFNKISSTIEQLIQPPEKMDISHSKIDVQTSILNSKGAEISDLEPRVTFTAENDFTVSLDAIPRKAKPGIYTLKISLFTPEGLETYEQEFTWGVLAINSDKSMYAPGETAYLQMAALREDGHTICDAHLELKLKTPTGNESILPISQSGECGPNNVIDVPDYYAYYPVTEIGEYAMTLTNTDNGYSISDQFISSNDIPFSIQRSAPTRIFPPADYPVSLSVTPAQPFKGTFSEFVPENFIISDILISEKNSSSPTKVNYTVENIGKEKKISADVAWEANKTYILSYVFNAPDISPYMFLLGAATLDASPAVTTSTPLTTSTAFINDLNESFFIGSFQEKRQWQIASDAVGIIDPNGDGTSTCSPTPAGSLFSTVDDKTRSPTSPDTSDYFTCYENESAIFDMSSLSNIASVTQIDAYAFYKNDSTDMQFQAELWNAAETVQYGTTQTLTVTTTQTWGTTSFSGLSLTQAELNGLKIKYKNIRLSGTQVGSHIYSFYGSVTYTPDNEAPTINTIYVNGGNNINLTEGSTTTVYVTSTISDTDGYNDMTSLSGKLYRSSVTSSEGCSTNNNNCYSPISCQVSNCSGNSCVAICEFHLYYFAEPTDVDTPWESDYWRGWIQVTDSLSQTASAHSSAGSPELSSLLALDITTSTAVNYGTLPYLTSPEPNYTDQRITVQATGNTSLDILLYTSDLTNGESTFSGTYQKYSLASTTSYTSASSTALTTTTPGAEIELNIKKATTTLYTPEGYIWLGARTPFGVASGVFSSTITILGKINEIASW